MMKTCLEYIGLKKLNFLISQNISTDLKGQKKNKNCTMDDVRCCFLGLQHSTTPAVVTTNKI